MEARNSCLVDFALVDVKEGEYLHYVGQRWAEPDVDCAATQMRRLVDEPGYAQEIGGRAARDIRTNLAPEVIAEKLINRLEELARSASKGDVSSLQSLAAPAETATTTTENAQGLL